MRIVRHVAELRRALAVWHEAAEPVALVPTMGALHPGHISLVGLARARAPRVVASLFVNPRQFGPKEDFARYPRDEACDAALLEAAGVDLLWAPDIDAMYPEGFATTIVPEGPARGLEADLRPGFFSGVATVVAKLLLQTGADVAVFGEKDWQQLQVIRRLVADLDIPVAIVPGPTMREPDGLAMSSRNAYLDPQQRARAAALFSTLAIVAGRIEAGEAIEATLADGRRSLSGDFDGLDYLELRAAETLEPMDRLDRPARLLAAVRLGSTRLIDNVAVMPAS